MRFAIAGEGPLRHSLEGLIAELKLTEHFRLCGFRDDVVNFILALDLFVCSSLWEGGPLVVIEAMLLGKTVVTTPVGLTPELIADGRTGYLVPPSDHETLASRILTVLDGKLGGRLSIDEARRTAANLTNPALNARAFDDVLERLAGRRTLSRASDTGRSPTTRPRHVNPVDFESARSPLGQFQAPEGGQKSPL